MYSSHTYILQTLLLRKMADMKQQRQSSFLTIEFFSNTKTTRNKFQNLKLNYMCPPHLWQRTLKVYYNSSQPNKMSWAVKLF